MFGLLAALNSLPNQREGREALNYENYIRTGQGLPSTKIYRESSVDKRARKELAVIRYKERLQQQVKFVRLMKKLLIKAENETPDGEIDEELEQMRIKVAQLELKVERAAREKDISCEDMFNMDKPDDAYDIELEQMIRTTSSSIPTTENIQSKITKQSSRTINETLKEDNKASGDNVTIQSSSINDDNPYDYGDQCLVERICKNKLTEKANN
jgi:hypothetical protein